MTFHGLSRRMEMTILEPKKNVGNMNLIDLSIFPFPARNIDLMTQRRINYFLKWKRIPLNDGIFRLNRTWLFLEILFQIFIQILK